MTKILLFLLILVPVAYGMGPLPTGREVILPGEHESWRDIDTVDNMIAALGAGVSTGVLVKELQVSGPAIDRELKVLGESTSLAIDKATTLIGDGLAKISQQTGIGANTQTGLAVAGLVGATLLGTYLHRAFGSRAIAAALDKSSNLSEQEKAQARELLANPLVGGTATVVSQAAKRSSRQSWR